MRCHQLQFLALNNCPAATTVFSSEDMLSNACEGMKVAVGTRQYMGGQVIQERPTHSISSQVLSHLELAGNTELDGNVSTGRIDTSL